MLTMPWAPEDTVGTLKQTYLQEAHPVKHTRLHALWLLRRDWSRTASGTSVRPALTKGWI